MRRNPLRRVHRDGRLQGLADTLGDAGWSELGEGEPAAEADARRRRHRDRARHQALRRLRGRRRRRLRDPSRRVLLDARPVGLRQDHDAADDRRLRAAHRGRIPLEGEDVSQVPPYKRNVNTVFQQYALFPHMTVRRQRRVRAPVTEGRARAEIDEARRRAARGRAARRLRRPQAGPALRRPAAARRARPGAR